GLARQYTSLQDGTIFSVRSDGHIHPATGVNGGGTGRTARLFLDFGHAGQRSLSSKETHLVLDHGQNIRIETGGAGGLGEPHERPIEKVRTDFENGIISAEDLETYGQSGIAQ